MGPLTAAAPPAPHINAAGLGLLKLFEGLRLAAYQDVAGIWTIGYGHIMGVRPGQTITEAQAESLLANDLHPTEAAVFAACSRPASQYEYAAMVCLAFNIGRGGFKTSTVLREHNRGRTKDAGEAFLLWNMATIDGRLRVVAGLTNRRRAERALYLFKG